MRAKPILGGGINIPGSDVEEWTVAPMPTKAAGNDQGVTIGYDPARKRHPELSVPLRRVFG